MNGEVRLSLVQKPKEENAWCVSVEGMGFPDFTIKAGNLEAAERVLSEFVHNELDGKEDVVDDDSLMP